MSNVMDLHLVSWNRPKMTELVIRTIHRNTKKENFRLVVLDNGSDEQTKAMLHNLADNGWIDELVDNPDNKGLEYARQFMLLHCTTSEFFVDIDNDCLPPPIEYGQDWLEGMRDLMNMWPEYAAISMRTQVMIGTGNIFEEADANKYTLVDFPHPGGSFRMMRTETVQAVGGWTRYALGRGSEERFICGKLHEAGWKTGFAVHIQCLHLFGTRGDNGTDRWGYDKRLKPGDTGHSDISHPALTNGDDLEEVKKYAGDTNAVSNYTE